MTEDIKQKDEIYGKPAGLGARIAAASYDAVIVGIIFVIPLVLIAQDHWILALCVLLVLLICFVYGLGRNGQSMGKLIVGIRVVALDGERAGYWKIIRKTIGYVLNIIFAWGSILLVFRLLSSINSLRPWDSQDIPLIQPILGSAVIVLSMFAGLLTLPFNNNERSVSDYIAGTKVIYKSIVRNAWKILGIGIIVIIFAGIVFVIPQYISLIHKAQTEEAKGKLGALRSAITIYYTNYNNEWPERLDDIVPIYSNNYRTDPGEILTLHMLKGKPDTWKLDPTPETDITAEDIDNSTAWMYNNKTGHLAVNFNQPGYWGTPCHTW